MRLSIDYGLVPEYHVGPYRVDLAKVDKNGKVTAFYEVFKTNLPNKAKLEAMLNVCTKIFFVTMEGQVSRLMPDWTVEHAFWLSEW